MNNLCPKQACSANDTGSTDLRNPEFWKSSNMQQFHRFGQLRKMVSCIWQDINEKMPVDLRSLEKGSEIFRLSQKVADAIEAEDIVVCNRLNVLARMCETEWFAAHVLELIKQG